MDKIIKKGRYKIIVRFGGAWRYEVELYKLRIFIWWPQVLLKSDYSDNIFNQVKEWEEDFNISTIEDKTQKIIKFPTT